MFSQLSEFYVRVGLSPQTSARQMLRTEDKRSTTGDAFLCAAAAEAWSHDAFVSKQKKIFIVVSSLISSAQELDHHTLACLGSSIICFLGKEKTSAPVSSSRSRQISMRSAARLGLLG